MIDEIILLRHGRTSYNLRHHLQGQVDVPLDIIGQWQVDQSGLVLAQRYYWAKVNDVATHPDKLSQPGPHVAERNDSGGYRQANACSRHLRVISSDLFRAVQTAHAFADILGLSVELDSRLREQSFGLWDGMTENQVRRFDSYSSDAFDAWRAHDDHNATRYKVESSLDVGLRGAQALNNYVEQDKTNPRPTTLMLVSHGGLITATLKTLLNLTQANTTLGGIHNAFWSTLIPEVSQTDRINWKLAEYNCGPEIAYTTDWENGPAELRNPDMPLVTPGL